jgi:hypothetical protein
MLTSKQVSALRYLISKADVVDLTKRIVTHLVNNSEGLTKEVCFVLHQDREGYTKEEIHKAALDVKTLLSSNCNVHFNALLTLSGCEMYLSCHYGHLEGTELNTSGQFPGQVRGLSEEIHPTDAPTRYTFWLSKNHFNLEELAPPLTVTKADLDQIDLEKPGLYDDAS